MELHFKNCPYSIASNNYFRTSEEQEWTATELKNSLRSIEWDLEDLEDTIQVDLNVADQDDCTVRFQIVEKNPTKFRIEASELAVRKGFIESTKEEVRLMKERLTNQSRGNLERLAATGGSPSHHVSSGASKYSRLPSTADSPHR